MGRVDVTGEGEKMFSGAVKMFSVHAEDYTAAQLTRFIISLSTVERWDSVLPEWK